MTLSFHFFSPELWQLPMWCTDMFKSVHNLILEITECNTLKHMFCLALCSCMWTRKLPGAIFATEYQKRLLLWGGKKKKKLLSYRQHKTHNAASRVLEWWAQLLWENCQSKEFTEHFSTVYTKFQISSNLFSYLRYIKIENIQ